MQSSVSPVATQRPPSNALLTSTQFLKLNEGKDEHCMTITIAMATERPNLGHSRRASQNFVFSPSFRQVNKFLPGRYQFVFAPQKRNSFDWFLIVDLSSSHYHFISKDITAQ
jgi:hypothetical protein